MSVNDPIGDMLTRIRNAQERGKSKVSTPASRLRERVLEVLQSEGFIRGFATVQQGEGKAEIEIERRGGLNAGQLNSYTSLADAYRVD